MLPPLGWAQVCGVALGLRLGGVNGDPAGMRGFLHLRSGGEVSTDRSEGLRRNQTPP